ncbi:OpgC family protein [Qingshengfaniella alkalisoli]|uniref:OpgC domain-containing protein n=1 Tax=Qingshengfaniella alkalisoli TaxID=2599296 RepID=A0A5B8JBR0_9RHOB|nr:OpgC domain-containing protein [Qingshengfaniella alkalisoli]QDY71667.1 OpgC domain-containing protein [Qingshengfaniella alkalisoli]
MTQQASPERKPPSRTRDPRLDFFRGVAMYVILLSHVPSNPWALWTPSRFGFSDAAEIFVFCSGMASAIAFGTIFQYAGWWMGTLRILLRMWQIYWAHLGVFFVALFTMLVLNQTGWFEKDYVDALNLYPFIRETGRNMIGLMTMTYVPNYFDILPMYFVILGLVPPMMLLAQISPKLVIMASLCLWAYVTAGGLELPAEYWFSRGSERQWFFNPFAWQLVFFTGFGLMAGWIPKPPKSRAMIAIACAVVVISLPLAWHETVGMFAEIRAWRKEWWILLSKTDQGILRYIHFLSLAYLAWAAVGPMGSRLLGGPIRDRVTPVVSKVGQQTLAVFMTSMVLSRLMGVLLDVMGRGVLQALVVNVLGIALLSLTAYFVAYLKAQPWRNAVRAALDGR